MHVEIYVKVNKTDQDIYWCCFEISHSSVKPCGWALKIQQYVTGQLEKRGVNRRQRQEVPWNDFIISVYVQVNFYCALFARADLEHDWNSDKNGGTDD